MAVRTIRPQKNTVSGSFNVTPRSPFVFTADLKDDAGSVIKKSSAGEWKSIEQVKVRYEVDGKKYELPYFTIYPPTSGSQEKTSSISIKTVKIKSKKKAEVNIESPDSSPFEVTKVEVIQESENSQNTTVAFGSKLGDLKYANSGSINFPMQTSFELDPKVIYTVKVEVKDFKTGNILKAQANKITFINDIIMTIKNIDPNFTILVNDRDSFIDNVLTEGNGSLGVNFITKGYAENVKTNFEQLSEGNHKVTFSNLDKLGNDTFSSFYYTVNGTDATPPYLMIKKLPVLQNFRFNGTKENEVLMEFSLPEYVRQDQISIKISDGKGVNSIEVKGNAVIKPNEIDKTNIVAKLPKEITDLVAKDKVLNVIIDVKYKNIPIYSLGMTLFNQKLLNQKISELTAETASKAKNRDRSKILKTVEEIAEIANATGNTINDKDIQKVVTELSDGENEKIKNTMNEIGKWALLAGKIILPLLL